VLAIGAPAGWLCIRLTEGASASAELSEHTALYVYMWIGTTIAFSIFGLVLGIQETKLEELSLVDALTRLHNVRYFRARLQEEMALSQRTRKPLALVIMDLDHFKKVNDAHGHPVGDQVLIQAGAALAAVIRKGETAGRVGGEEFGLLLPACTAEEARSVVERVRESIARISIAAPSGAAVRVTASAGIASTAERPDATADQLYALADEALYQAKQAGRNRSAVVSAVSVAAAKIR